MARRTRGSQGSRDSSEMLHLRRILQCSETPSLWAFMCVQVCSSVRNARSTVCTADVFRCVDCSDCIRQHGDLQYRSLGSRTCPDCRAPWQESDLEVKAVHSLDVAVKAFQAAKPQVLATAQRNTIETPASTSSDGPPQPESRKRSRHNSVERNAAPERAQPTAVGKASGTSSGCKAAVQAAGPKIVPPGCGCCPMCHRVFSLRFLPSHVESCLISTEASEPSGKAADVQKHPRDGVVDLTETGTLSRTWVHRQGA